MKDYTDALGRVASFLRTERNPRRSLRDLVAAASARAFTRNWSASDAAKTAPPSELGSENVLRAFFESRNEGPGIWKWEHYFEIYQRHFRRFVGRPVRILEVGIYSGGSLDMWQAYFGNQCEVIGVDIEEACRSYARPNVKVLIGDQSDRDFWRRTRSEIGPIDILVDDGGHLPQQQIITLEEMLPHISPGGVFLCEDVHGAENAFLAYVYGLIGELNAVNLSAPAQSDATPFQRAISSINIYPYVVAIERTREPVTQFIAPKHGTQWQPFL